MVIAMGLLYIKIDYLQTGEVHGERMIFPEYFVTQYLPYYRYCVTGGSKDLKYQLVVDLFAGHVPFLKYASETDEEEVKACEEIIAWNESQEWNDALLKDFEAENSTARATMQENAVDSAAITDTPEAEKKELIQTPDISSTNQLFSVLKHDTVRRTYSKQNVISGDTLKKRFFTIDPTTDIRPGQLELDSLLNMDMSVEKDDAPQILIYHTHSQEAFADSIPGDSSTSIVGAGEFLAQILSSQYGYKVIHHCGEYDVESRDYAYAKAAPALEAILKEYPSIDVVIDLHRDAVAENTRLVTNMDGIDVAQFMLFDGLSYTRERGEITYLENPYIQSNLALAFQMKLTADCYYPDLSRKIYLKGYRYNMQYCSKSLLIELGAQTNTVQEVMNACIPLAHTIDIVLSGNTPSLIE